MRQQTFEFPPDKKALRARAIRLEWISLGLLTLAATLIGFTTGQSQAMKTTWISDLLALIPPVTYLIATHYELKPPTLRFPYGYTRSVSVSFLATSAALTIAGLWLFLDAVLKLIKKERPPVGAVELFGYQFWLGWAMIGALVISVITATVLGQIKRRIAEPLVDRNLRADADMNRADYMSESAAIVGVLGIGIGWWWADSVAAGLISLSIIYDGWENMRFVVADLMDEAPTRLGESDLESLPDRLTAAAAALPWVRDAKARLREHGRTITGEVFVVPATTEGILENAEAAGEALKRVDWRLHGIVIVPVRELD